MKPLTRGYLVLLAVLVVGTVAAWFILWHITYNNSVMESDGTEFHYIRCAFDMAVMLGIVAGCWFALVAPRRQFLHAFLFSAVAAGVGFAVLGCVRTISINFESYEEWRRAFPWLFNIFYWVDFWINDGIYYWLLPLLVSQLLAVAITQWAKPRCPIWLAKHNSAGAALTAIKRRAGSLVSVAVLICLGIIALTPVKSTLLGNALCRWEAQVLLALRADPNSVNWHGFSILRLAAGWGDDALVRELINHGARVDFGGADEPGGISEFGGTDGSNPLCEAASEGHYSTVRILLDHGAQVNFGPKDLYQTPLECAAHAGHKSIVELLLSRGADPSACSSDFTAVCLACERHHFDVAEAILSREGSVKSRPDGRPECLGIATREGALSVVRMLLDKGAQVNPTDHVTSSPLWCAAYYGRYEIAKLLLTRGADPNYLDHNQETPLGAAVFIDRRRSDIIELLLKSGADPNAGAPLLIAARVQSSRREYSASLRC